MAQESEAMKRNFDFVMRYGYFSAALEIISECEKINPQDPELPKLVAMLKEKIQLSNAAAQEAVDQRFFELMEFIVGHSEDEIFELILASFNSADMKFQKSLIHYCKELQSLDLWGQLDPENDVYDDFRRRAKMLKNHSDDLLWLHNRLADARSKNVLFAVLSNWLYMDCTTKNMYKERVYPEYFDPTIFPRTKDEVFVDVGAAAGDSALNFISAYLVQYKRIYCYEITPESFQVMQRLLSKHDVDLRQKAAWSSPGTMRLSIRPGSSTNQVGEHGEIEIETVRIDDDITEPITFLKMDIEGAEMEALKGCRRQISENRPKLAICTYHGYNDIYAVPRLIDEIAPGYEFYMRFHGGMYAMATEFTLLGVPK